MSNTISSVKERLYLCKETTWATAVAPTNSNCCRFISGEITPVMPELQRPDKNADEDEPIGTPGRRSCTWKVSLSAAGSGTSGVAPDCAPLLEAAMGTQSTNNFTMSSNIKSLTIYKYDQTGLAQAAIGAIVSSMKFSIGGDFPIVDFSGEAYWGYDTAQAADGSTPSVAKGGLASFPTEPSAPVTNGAPPPGFAGSVTLDGNVYSTLLSSSITVNTGRELPKDGMNVYPTAPVTKVRTYVVDFGLKEDDSSNLQSFIAKGNNPTKPPVNGTFVIGQVSGIANIWTWTVKNMLLPSPSLDGSQPQRHINFQNTRAHPTSSGAFDALALAIT